MLIRIWFCNICPLVDIMRTSCVFMWILMVDIYPFRPYLDARLPWYNFLCLSLFQLDSALLQFPSTVTALMDKCGIVLDSQITSHHYFDPITYLKQSQSLNQLITLFVQRNFSVWKEPEVLNWFTERCKHVLDTLSENAAIIQEYQERWGCPCLALFIYSETS